MKKLSFEDWEDSAYDLEGWVKQDSFLGEGRVDVRLVDENDRYATIEVHSSLFTDPIELECEGVMVSRDEHETHCWIHVKNKEYDFGPYRNWRGEFAEWLNDAKERGLLDPILKNKTSSFREQLVKLGKYRKDLRPHIRPVLAEIKKSKSTIAGMSYDEIIKRWNKGNNRGEGYGVRDQELVNWEFLGKAGAGNNRIDVYKDNDGNIVGVGGSHGPWCVVLKPSREASTKASGTHGQFEIYVRDNIIEPLARKLQKRGYNPDPLTVSCKVPHENNKALNFVIVPEILKANTVGAKLEVRQKGRVRNYIKGTTPGDLVDWAVEQNELFARELKS